MSYILDALKKADAEREQGQVPGLHTPTGHTDLPDGPQLRTPPLWVMGLGALLVLIALGAVWLWPRPVAVIATAPTQPQSLPAGPVAEPEPTPAPEPVAPVVVVADSDKDGVPDSSDLCPGTPSTDKVDATGCSIFTEKEVNFTLKAQFANDSSEIKPEYSAEIADLAAFLKRFPGTDVEIGGHASNVGSAAYNLKLSERRADAVAKVLLNEHGISASRVTVKGYGISRPKVEGNTPAAHAANRRIEAVVTATIKEKVER